MNATSWEVTRLTTWTSAGGRADQPLGPAFQGSSIRRELSQRGTTTLVLAADLADALARDRAILRVDRRELGDYVEVRVAGRRRAVVGATALVTVTGHPRVYDLADLDLVRQTVAGRTITRIDLTAPPRQLLQELVFDGTFADALAGVSLGTVAFDTPMRLTTGDNGMTPAQVVDAILAQTLGELQWRINPDGSEWLDIVEFIGDDALLLPVAVGENLTGQETTEDYGEVATAFRIRGELETADGERATIGENQWRVASVTALGSGSHAVELRALRSNASPVLEDGQFAGAPDVGILPRFLQRADGVTRLMIGASRVADSCVDILGTPPLVGEYVQIVADVDGTPLELLELPAAMRRFGRATAEVLIPGGRGERQYASNGGHESGIVDWFPVNGGAGVAIPRSAFGVTESLQANGARAAAVGTGTPFLVKGLTPTVGAIYQGDELRTGGGTCAVQADAVPDATGKLALTLDPGLPVALANNDPVTLVRRETRVLELAADHSRLMPIVRFTDDNTAGLPRSVSVGAVLQGDGRTYGVRGRYASDPVSDPPITPILAGPWTADVSTAGIPGQIGADGDAPGDVFIVMPTGPAPVGTDGVSFFLTPGELFAGVVVGTRIAVRGSTIVAGYGAFTYFPYRVTAIVGLQVTTVADVGSLPPGTTAVFGHMDIGPSVQMPASNVMIAAGTAFTLTHTRETRTLQADGAHLAGAATLNTKAIAALARRDLLNGDTVSFRRPVTAGFTITAIVEHGDGTATATVDSGSNTLDALDPEEWNWLLDMSRPFFRAAFLLTGGSATVAWYPTAVASGTIELARLDGLADYAGVGPETVESTWFVTDTYTNTAGDAFGNDAQATVTAAIPAGRTYAAGTRCWTNFHGAGADGAQHDQTTELRLVADVVGPASSFAIYATDGYTSLWNGSATPPTPCYRVMGSSADDASTLPIPGNVLYAAATAIANGAGEAAVTLVAANPNAITDGTPVLITRPALIASTDRQDGSALRLLCGTGGSGEPLTSTPGWAQDFKYFRVPEGSTRSIVLKSEFALSQHGWFPGEAPVVAIVDVAGAILAWQAFAPDGIDIDSERGAATHTVRAVIAASGVYGFRLYGGNAAVLSRWCVHLQSMWTLGEAMDVPYLNDSYASRMQLAAYRYLPELMQPRTTDTLRVQLLSREHLVRAGLDPDLMPSVVLGGRLQLEHDGRVLRTVAYTEAPDSPIGGIEAGALGANGARLLGTAALAAGVGGR